MLLIYIGVVIGITIIILIALALMYRVVDPSEAHVVVGPTKKMVCTPDEKIEESNGRWYLHIPLIRTVRILSTLVQELVVVQETIEKGQARYNVKSSLKYRIKNVSKASETYSNDEELKKMLEEVIRSAVRAITVKYDVVEARANKLKIEQDIRAEIKDDLDGWGQEVVNFQLVDFKDTADSQIISNISKRREVEIEAQTREENAEKLKQAKIKEAESDEKAKEREIARDKKVGEYEQQRDQAIAKEQKLAKQAFYEVKEVEQVRTQEIEKKRQVVEAEQRKEVEEINKQQKKLVGEGTRLQQEEEAKGLAAPILEKGLAEAKAKDALQLALNKFKDEAIRALVAEKIVEKDQAIGIASAEALKTAQIKAFLGGSKGDEEAFNVGRAIESLTMSSSSSGDSILHRIKMPNDLGGGVPITVAKKTDKK